MIDNSCRICIGYIDRIRYIIDHRKCKTNDP